MESSYLDSQWTQLVAFDRDVVLAAEVVINTNTIHAADVLMLKESVAGKGRAAKC